MLWSCYMAREEKDNNGCLPLSRLACRPDTETPEFLVLLIPGKP